MMFRPRDTITLRTRSNVGISIIDIIVNIVATCLKVRRIGPRWRKLDDSSVLSGEFNIFNPVEIVSLNIGNEN